MANQITQEDSFMPYNISLTSNKARNICWDDFDINEETPSGASTTHTTHGILIQEVLPTYFEEVELREYTKNQRKKV